MVKKLIVKISPDGEVQMEVQGAVGNECEALSAPFEQALGAVTQRELKDAYFVNTVDEGVQGTVDGGMEHGHGN